MQRHIGNPLEPVSAVQNVQAVQNVLNKMIATGSVERKIRELMFESLLGVDINGKANP